MDPFVSLASCHLFFEEMQMAKEKNPPCLCKEKSPSVYPKKRSFFSGASPSCLSMVLTMIHLVVIFN